MGDGRFDRGNRLPLRGPSSSSEGVFETRSHFESSSSSGSRKQIPAPQRPSEVGSTVSSSVLPAALPLRAPFFLLASVRTIHPHATRHLQILTRSTWRCRVPFSSRNIVPQTVYALVAGSQHVTPQPSFEKSLFIQLTPRRSL